MRGQLYRVKLGKNWNWSWSILRYHIGIRFDGRRKITKSLLVQPVTLIDTGNVSSPIQAGQVSAWVNLSISSTIIQACRDVRKVCIHFRSNTRVHSCTQKMYIKFSFCSTTLTFSVFYYPSKRTAAHKTHIKVMCEANKSIFHSFISQVKPQMHKLKFFEFSTSLGELNINNINSAGNKLNSTSISLPSCESYTDRGRPCRKNTKISNLHI